MLRTVVSGLNRFGS